MTHHILDASALLAMLLAETGAERVQAAINGASITAINLAEVVSHYARAGIRRADVEAILRSLPIQVIDADTALSYEAGMLRALTGGAGLSLGDRYCLAAAKREGATVLTADKAWLDVAEDVDANIELIR